MGWVYPIFRSSARFPLKIRRKKEEKQKIPPHKKYRHRPFLDGCGHSSFNFISLCFLRQPQSDTLRFCSFLFPNKHRHNLLFCFAVFFNSFLSYLYPVFILFRYRYLGIVFFFFVAFLSLFGGQGAKPRT